MATQKEFSISLPRLLLSRVAAALAILSSNFIDGVLCSEIETSTSAVTLLFENDGNWTRFGEVPSALWFHEAVGYDEAMTICAANNETLLGVDDLPHFTNQFSYRQYTGEMSSTTKLWIDYSSTSANSSTGTSRRPTSFTPTTDTLCEEEDDDPVTELGFLCTNSAPLTTQVDTNFTNSSVYPRTTVVAGPDGETSFVGTRDHLTFRFMGIPYAQPPVGSLRFRYSVPWNGTEVGATGFKNACPQYGYFDGDTYGLNPWGNSEDCLYLNVYTNYIPSGTSDNTTLRPVLFWMHGGGFSQGTGADATFDGGPLVSRTDAVLVTINYRLNIFGLLALNDTSANITGNYAISDKVLALQWVQDHIAAFGGDPEKVMIFGQSAGGSSVVDLLMSPKAEGLFSTGIIQSGGAGLIVSLDEATEEVLPYIQNLCNGTGAVLLECLQTIPTDTILRITENVTSWTTSSDGVYRSNYSVDTVALGPSAVNSVPIISGYMPNEGQSLLGETIIPNATASNFTNMLDLTVGEALAANVTASGLWNLTDTFTAYNATIDVYTDYVLTCANEDLVTTASAMNAFPAIYIYEMQRAYALSYYDPYDLCTFPVGQPQPYYKCHSGDLYEVFGTYHIFDQVPRELQDMKYTNLVQDMWASFARTEDPNPSQEYLQARGYNSTLKVFESWSWEPFVAGEEKVAELDWPGVSTKKMGFPDVERCKVILSVSDSE